MRKTNYKRKCNTKHCKNKQNKKHPMTVDCNKIDVRIMLATD